MNDRDDAPTQGDINRIYERLNQLEAHFAFGLKEIHLILTKLVEKQSEVTAQGIENRKDIDHLAVIINKLEKDTRDDIVDIRVTLKAIDADVRRLGMSQVKLFAWGGVMFTIGCIAWELIRRFWFKA